MRDTLLLLQACIEYFGHLICIDIGNKGIELGCEVLVPHFSGAASCVKKSAMAAAWSPKGVSVGY